LIETLGLFECVCHRFTASLDVGKCSRRRNVRYWVAAYQEVKRSAILLKVPCWLDRQPLR